MQGEILLRKLVNFCQELRQEDIAITPSETIDATRAVTFTDMSDPESLYIGLKTTLVKRAEYYSKFDVLFRRFWVENKTHSSSNVNPLGRIIRASKRLRSEEEKDSPRGRANQIPKGPASNPLQSIISEHTNPKHELQGQQAYAIYSPLETTGRKSFGKESPRQDRALLKRGLRTFARKMATRPGRRFETASDGRIDFRRTMRASLKSGYLTDIHLSEKKISKARLVILADISGSMDVYSDRLLKLIYHACNSIPRTQVFGFSTQLIPLNKHIQGRPFKEAARVISENVNIWSSGTRIGSALGQLIVKHHDSLRPSSVVVIVSDGWEIGDLDVFKKRLAEIRMRVARIVWLNPHADSPNYSPVAAGMKAALPFVDIFSGLDVFTDRRKFDRAFGKAIRIARKKGPEILLGPAAGN